MDHVTARAQLKEASTTQAGGRRTPVMASFLALDFDLTPREAGRVLVLGFEGTAHLPLTLRRAREFFLPGPAGVCAPGPVLETLEARGREPHYATWEEIPVGGFDTLLAVIPMEARLVHALRGTPAAAEVIALASRLGIRRVLAVGPDYNLRDVSPHVGLLEPVDLAPGVRVTGVGGTFPNELSCLYALARDLDAGDVVEIGSYRGKSTAALALGLRNPASRLYSVDVGHHAEFLPNLQDNGVSDRVTPIVMDSALAAAQFGSTYPEAKVRVLFIDGAHDRQGFLADLTAWEPLLEPGGMLLCHDYLWNADIIELVYDRVVCSGRYAGAFTVDYTFGARKEA